MIFRIIYIIFATLLTIYFLLVAKNQLQKGVDLYTVIFDLGIGVAACFLWYYGLERGEKSMRRKVKFALIFGCSIGFVGFIAGYFGPLFLMPNSNQGPLFGIFVTAPLGFTLGSVVGWFFARCHETN